MTGLVPRTGLPRALVTHSSGWFVPVGSSTFSRGAAPVAVAAGPDHPGARPERRGTVHAQPRRARRSRRAPRTRASRSGPASSPPCCVSGATWPSSCELLLERALGHAEAARHRDERARERARRVEERRERHAVVSPKPPQDDPERDALERPGADREERRDDEVAGVVSSVARLSNASSSLGPMRPSAPGRRATRPRSAREGRRRGDEHEERATTAPPTPAQTRPPGKPSSRGR